MHMVRFAPVVGTVKFEPAALKIGSGWYLRVTFPNGEPAQVSGFFSEREAKLWVDEEAEAWIASYRRNRRRDPTIGGEGD
jgi:hypothetical protein